MAYTPTVWKDGEAPALNAENLNKMEQGIKDATDAADKALNLDPLGTWKYGGKVTTPGENGKVTFYSPQPGETFSSVINQLCVCVNSLEGKYAGNSTTVNIAAGFICEYADASLNASTYFNFFSGFMDSGDSFSNMDNSKFLIEKIGLNKSSVYYRFSFLQGAFNMNTILLREGSDIEKISFYIKVDYGVQINSLDVDLYYR